MAPARVVGPASVAQWKSSSVLRKGLGVRIPSGARERRPRCTQQYTHPNRCTGGTRHPTCFRPARLARVYTQWYVRPVAPKDTHTPARPFRIPDEEYDPALAKARAAGTNLTAVVRRKIRDYLEEDDERSN